MSLLREVERTLGEEIVQVTGCTEPVSVAFALAQARHQLRRPFDPGSMTAELRLSSEVMRNASTAVVPRLNRRGLRNAAAAGLCAATPDFNLMPSVDLEAARMLLARRGWMKAVTAPEKGIYIDAILHAPGETVSALISGRHDIITQIKQNGRTVYSGKTRHSVPLTFVQIMELARARNPVLEGIARDFLIMQVRRDTSLPLDRSLAALVRARMLGSAEPIMTITGSGNQGIFIGVPFYEAYKERGQAVLPAALFALLVQIHLSETHSRISGACGLACKAAPALAAAFAFDRGAEADEIQRLIQDVTLRLREMDCPGARPGCGNKALKAYRTAMACLRKTSDHLRKTKGR
ncbi:MAG: L-serine ammonia-lyase, iron-sulfur-dependent, subunit alpha [Kiritimatiellae bacterium]|nr:L-serine ammonia-lyase, iron-sulfur-dependent, subunit alpha [Kiritimatiellia bacterium]